jgi:hypothetical protein
MPIIEAINDIPEFDLPALFALHHPPPSHAHVCPRAA